MVRESRPPARDPGRAWLARRSTMATSTPANASSPASISPVGPPPAITTACWVIATRRPASHRSRPAHHIPPRRVPATAPRVPSSVRRPRATRTSTTNTHFAPAISVGLACGPRLCGTPQGLPQAPLCGVHWRWTEWVPAFLLSSAVDGQPSREAATRRVRLHRRPWRISHEPPDAAAERQFLTLCSDSAWR